MTTPHDFAPPMPADAHRDGPKDEPGYIFNRLSIAEQRKWLTAVALDDRAGSQAAAFIVASEQDPDNIDERFLPRVHTQVDGRDIFIGKPMIDEHGREYIVSYVEDEELGSKPVLCYRSESDGNGWRIARGVLMGHLEKSAGRDMHRLGGYSQTLRPVEEMRDALESQSRQYREGSRLPNEVSFEEIHRRFSLMALERTGLDTLEHEVVERKLSSGSPRQEELLYGVIEVGRGVRSDMRENYAKGRCISDPELTRGLEPDFSAGPISSRAYTHPLAGRVVVEQYSVVVNDEQLTWHVARDETGGVWLDSITSSDNSTTSYGTRSDVVVAGALSMKPFEYVEQLKGMTEGADFTVVEGRSKYADLRHGYWGQMAWVCNYTEQRQGAESS